MILGWPLLLGEIARRDGAQTLSTCCFGFAAIAALYLYVHPGPRAYYLALRPFAIARLRLRDFRLATSLPLYTGIAALGAGGWLGAKLFALGGARAWHDSADDTGYVCMVVLCAVTLASFAHEITARLVDRRPEATG